MSKMEKNGMEKLAKVLDSRMEEHSGGGFIPKYRNNFYVC